MIITNKWVKLALLNIFLVSLIGLLMRYKIVFPMPGIEQKYLLHAHSHFAFVGWVSHVLFMLIAANLGKYLPRKLLRKYDYIIVINLISAYGMLVTFSIQGYAFFSITFSTLSIFVFYLFSVFLLMDLKKINVDYPASKWYKAAVFLGVLSTAGTFYLVKMMVTKSINQDHYLGAIYFYLHFQYNGWFLFAAFGIISEWLQNKLVAWREDRRIFWLFFLSSIPCYFLSTLWAKLPVWLYVLVVLATLAQTIGWFLFAKQIIALKNNFAQKISRLARNLFVLVIVAFTLKILLQLGSVVPLLSKLAFGFRSIVIAYLHLILLGVFTIFFIAYFFSEKMIRITKLSIMSASAFVVGIILNEFVLMVQGAAGISFRAVPYANEALFYITVGMFVSLLLLFISQFTRNSHHSSM